MIQWCQTQKALDYINTRYDVNVVAKRAQTTGLDYIILPGDMSNVPGWKSIAKGQ